MAAYTLTRVLFLFWNWPLFVHDSATDIARAFFFGLRFDTAAILLTNSVLFALWMLPSRWMERKAVAVIDLTLFALINFVALMGNVGDAEYSKFIGKRTSFDVLGIAGDVEQQGLSIIAGYWKLFLVLVVLTVLVVWITSRLSRRSSRETWIGGALWRLAFIALVVLGIRGGFGFKPLSPMEAYFSPHHELGLLTLNTPFNVLKTKPDAEIEHIRYFEHDRDAINRLHEMTDPSRPPLGKLKGWNVVVLILESFASEYTGISNNYPGYTPFFDSLTKTKNAFFFKDSFANSRRSIEGIPAVFCGLMNIMDEPIITSDFASDRMDCLPKVLGSAGYSTYFLHGAHNGSMHFDSFSPMAGFDSFIGLNEYPYKDRPDQLDGYWGVMDEPMMQYATEIIDKAKKPVFLGLFSLSSHYPYFIPEKYRGKFRKGPIEIEESIGYTDYSLQQFFKTAATKPWFNHTIFVVTADHISKSEPGPAHDFYLHNDLGRFRVPILFYIPGLKDGQLKWDPERIVQHVDIMPTILDLLGMQKQDRLLIGQSVFDLGKPGRAYNYTTSSYWILQPKVFVDYGRPPAPQRAFTYTYDGKIYSLDEKSTSDPMFADAILNLKAVVHYMNEGLLGNRLYTWRDAK